MVDVGDKTESDRRAIARATVKMEPSTAALVVAGDAPKGDVIGTVRIAGIQATKRTADLIPLCHPLGLSFVGIEIDIDADSGVATIDCETRTRDRTGVEMEAMTGASVAALTLYDMVKGVERGVRIESVSLLEKTGGKQDWSASS